MKNNPALNNEINATLASDFETLSRKLTPKERTYLQKKIKDHEVVFRIVFFLIMPPQVIFCIGWTAVGLNINAGLFLLAFVAILDLLLLALYKIYRSIIKNLSNCEKIRLLKGEYHLGKIPIFDLHYIGNTGVAMNKTYRESASLGPLVEAECTVGKHPIVLSIVVTEGRYKGLGHRIDKESANVSLLSVKIVNQSNIQY